MLGVSAYLVMLGRRHLRSKLLVGSVVVVFVVAMGLSRVWLGHHWLTDVIAGWLVGLAWLGTVVTAHRVKVTLDRAEREGQPVTARAAFKENSCRGRVRHVHWMSLKNNVPNGLKMFLKIESS